MHEAPGPDLEEARAGLGWARGGAQGRFQASLGALDSNGRLGSAGGAPPGPGIPVHRRSHARRGAGALRGGGHEPRTKPGRGVGRGRHYAGPWHPPPTSPDELGPPRPGPGSSRRGEAQAAAAGRGLPGWATVGGGGTCPRAGPLTFVGLGDLRHFVRSSTRRKWRSQDFRSSPPTVGREDFALLSAHACAGAEAAGRGKRLSREECIVGK